MNLTPDHSTIKVATSKINWDALLPIPPKKNNWKGYIEGLIKRYLGADLGHVFVWGGDEVVQVNFSWSDDDPRAPKVPKFAAYLEKNLISKGMTVKGDPITGKSGSTEGLSLHFQVDASEKSWVSTARIGGAAQQYGLDPERTKILRRVALKLMDEQLDEKISQLPSREVDYRPTETLPEDFYA
jgi:hypothetical protein